MPASNIHSLFDRLQFPTRYRGMSASPIRGRLTWMPGDTFRGSRRPCEALGRDDTFFSSSFFLGGGRVVKLTKRNALSSVGIYIRIWTGKHNAVARINHPASLISKYKLRRSRGKKGVLLMTVIYTHTHTQIKKRKRKGFVSTSSSFCWLTTVKRW